MRPRSSLLLLLPLATAESFDYIIVGAGTCGLLLANRLSADPSTTVALIDPGPDERSNPSITDPAQWLSAASSYVNWNYSSAPQVNAAGQSIMQSAGRGIGGSSLINGMTYVRGDAAQFDAWRELGDEGWDWDSMFGYMKELEKFTAPEEWQTELGATYNSDFHGMEGDLHVGFSPVLQSGSFYSTIKKSWATIGYEQTEDPNGGDTRGFSVWPQTLDASTNKRWDAATAFYWDIEARKNLKLLNGTAQRIVWKDEKDGDPHARGIEYVTSENKTVRLHADREVILSAGSLRSPLILEASGVGHPDFLADLGIESVVDLPGVGENMVDQPNNNAIFGLNFSLPAGYAPYATFASAKDIFGDDLEAEAAAVKAKLPAWARQISEASDGRVSAENVEKLYDIQYRLLYEDGVTVAELLTTGLEKNVLSAFWPLMPFSRGSVHLTPSGYPSIDPKYFIIDHDLALQTRIARLSATAFATPPLSDIVSPVVGLPASAGDEEWSTYLREKLTGNAHCISTAAMMRRELGGVVDNKMRVYGTRGLRVVDASVVPMQISGHLTAMLYVIAQRAAEAILEDVA